MIPKLKLKKKIMYILISQAFIPFPSSLFSLPQPQETIFFVFDLVFNFKKYLCPIKCYKHQICEYSITVCK